MVHDQVPVTSAFLSAACATEPSARTAQVMIDAKTVCVRIMFLSLFCFSKDALPWKPWMINPRSRRLLRELRYTPFCGKYAPILRTLEAAFAPTPSTRAHGRVLDVR